MKIKVMEKTKLKPFLICGEGKICVFFSQLKMKKKWEKQNIVYKARRNGNKFKPKLMQETTLWQK